MALRTASARGGSAICGRELPAGMNSSGFPRPHASFQALTVGTAPAHTAGPQQLFTALLSYPHTNTLISEWQNPLSVL